jgi:cystathionine beta-synthase
MKKYGISQLPVRKDGDFVGSLNERKLFEELIENPDAPKKLIGEIMQKPFPMVEATTPIEEVARLMTNDNDAVIVALSDSTYHIVTPNDLVAQLG